MSPLLPNEKATTGSPEQLGWWCLSRSCNLDQDFVKTIIDEVKQCLEK